MKLAVFVTCLAAAISGALGTDCICSTHIARQLWPCQNKNSMFTGELYGAIDNPQCIPLALNVVTSAGWLAGIYNDEVVYMEKDVKVTPHQCSEPRSQATIKSNRACPPKMKQGTYLNPTTTTKPTTTSTTTTSTTTTTTTTTTTPKPTTTSTTPTTPTTVTQTTFVPTQTVPPSTKCDFFKLALHQVQKTSASHPRAQTCSDGTHTSTEALLFETCNNVNYNFRMWQQELKVSTNCWTIPQGEPVVYYMGTRPLLLAIFWQCLPTGEFEIAYQTCGSPMKIVPISATSIFKPEWFFSVRW